MGGGSETNTRSEYPPEFRPLATGAVNQLLALQGVLPMTQFAAPNPQGTAGLSPWQQYAMNLIPLLGATVEPVNQLNKLGTPVSMASLAMLNAADPTRAAQASLGVLGEQMGVGNAAQYAPSKMDQFASAIPSMVPYMPTTVGQETIFPGFQRSTLDAVVPSLSLFPQQVFYGTPTGVTTTPPSYTPVVNEAPVGTTPPPWYTQPPPWWGQTPTDPGGPPPQDVGSF